VLAVPAHVGVLAVPAHAGGGSRTGEKPDYPLVSLGTWSQASGMKVALTEIDAVAATTMRHGQMSPLHVHSGDEDIQMLEGRLTVYSGSEVVVLESGQSWRAPAGIPHTYRADSQDARVQCAARVRSAGHYEDFLRAVSHPAEMTPEEEMNLSVLAAAIGVEVLGAPGVLPS
jgi:quercetin dioxygenase-like cupin family protein